MSTSHVDNICNTTPYYLVCSMRKQARINLKALLYTWKRLTNSEGYIYIHMILVTVDLWCHEKSRFLGRLQMLIRSSISCTLVLRRRFFQRLRGSHEREETYSSCSHFDHLLNVLWSGYLFCTFQKLLVV